jgi:hypothetical protein
VVVFKLERIFVVVFEMEGGKCGGCGRDMDDEQIEVKEAASSSICSPGYHRRCRPS